ncbi:MAG: hypothetical protein ACTSQJ_00450 [Promethearchaeota archaeon]
MWLLIVVIVISLIAIVLIARYIVKQIKYLANNSNRIDMQNVALDFLMQDNIKKDLKKQGFKVKYLGIIKRTKIKKRKKK